MNTQDRPNIICILADDLGYGDLTCYQASGKIPTPHLDELAANGMRFTDAHASTAVCTPSRYNLLTGRYAWRSRLKEGIVWEWDEPLIERDRTTVASMLRDQGYTTHCVGKWHLGWDWQCKDGTRAGEHVDFGVPGSICKARSKLGDQIDFAAPVAGGPVTNGFDSYFGVDVPNFAPYTWFEDDRLAESPTVPKADHLYGQPGWSIPDWNHEAMLPKFAEKCCEVIRQGAEQEQPFFLYFPLTSPHSPITPNKEFVGSSGAGPYGDFVVETDAVIGQLVRALRETDQLNNTFILFTSDNGPEWKTDDIGAYERLHVHEHCSVGELRGIKRDVYEGGHRVPFIAHWPDGIKGGRECSHLVSLGDFFATCADLCNATLGEDEGEDSISFLPLLRGTDKAVRESTIFHSMRGTFALRTKEWLFIDGPNGTDIPDREPEAWNEARNFPSFDTPQLLFNLSEDIGERVNLYDQRPAKVAAFHALLHEHKELAGSRRSFAAADDDLSE